MSTESESGFLTRNELSAHINQVHYKITHFKCDKCAFHVLQAIETGQMLDFVPSIRKLPNPRYCCQNLEFFPNPNISNIRQLFSAENTAKNIFVVTLATTKGPFTLLII